MLCMRRRMTHQQEFSALINCIEFVDSTAHLTMSEQKAIRIQEHFEMLEFHYRSFV